MDLFFELTGYELKKVLCRKRTIIMLVLVVMISTISVFGTIIGNYHYYDENGNEIVVSRYEDEMRDRKYGEELSGRTIGAELIMEAVEAYRQVPLNGSVRYTDTTVYQNTARKYSEIYRIVRSAFDLNSMEEFQALTFEQADQFDCVVREKREYVIENSPISNNMRAYWQKCFDKMPKTLIYEYSGGYDRFISIMYSTAIMAGAAIAIMIAGIFSEEYTSGAASLILASRHGKGLVIGAKLVTAFAMAAVLISLLTAVSYAEAMIVWGNGGGETSILMLGDIFPYNMTIGQSVLLYMVCMFAAILLFTAVTLLLSALFKTPFNTVVVMAVLLIVPMFIAVPDGSPVWVYQLENLLPTNMMAYWGAMYEYQYEIFGIIIPPYVFLPIFASIVSLICVFGAYHVFAKHQIG